MGVLDDFKGSVMALVIIALIIGAFVLALDAFQDDLGAGDACPDDDGRTYYYNTSYDTSPCCVYQNTTDYNCTNRTASFAYNTTEEGLAGAYNASSYLSTIGTLLGVTALIAIVVGAFMFVRK